MPWACTAPRGAGVAERDGASTQVDIVQGTLAKAFGVIGGYIASTEARCDFIRSCGSGFIFTTSLPPAIAAAALGQRAPCQRPSRAACPPSGARRDVEAPPAAAGLPVMPSVTHIVPVSVGDAALCKQAGDLLMDRHSIYVQPINYPTVPRGTERLRRRRQRRCIPTTTWSRLVRAALQDVWQTLGLGLRAAAE